MAGIDKIYVESYSDYAKIRDFFLTHDFYTKRGNHIFLRNYLIYNDLIGTEEEKKSIKDWYSDGNSHPVTNTPWYVDKYLLDNCPLEIVQNYLHDVYNNPEKDLIPVDIDLVPATKIKVVSKGKYCANYPIPFYNHYTNKKCQNWTIEVLDDKDYWWYNENSDMWYSNNMMEPITSSCAIIKNRSIKSVIRKILKKWKLPIGCKIIVSGRYVGEEYLFKTK